MSESRKHDRKDFLAHIEFRSGAGIRNDRISDLSVGGCYIDSIVGVSVGDRIDFDLIHPNGGRLGFQGEVTHHTPGVGFGLKFVEMGKEQELFVERILS